MSDERLAAVLDATYHCFARHGVRRTTMEDIATAAGMSRPAVYQYVRNKDDAFRRLAERLFATARAAARAAAGEAAALPDRLFGILGPKLALTQRVFRDSPHATELLGEHARLTVDLDAALAADLKRLVVAALVAAEVPRRDAREIAEIAVALTRGVEADRSDDRATERRLRRGLALIVAGLDAAPFP
jgi:TetR/AcrR family transcriptional regulator